MDELLSSVLEGRFRVEKRLGAGAMAVVYLARDLELKREVALKLLSSPTSSDHSLLSRFKREVRMMANLSHRSIIKVMAHGSINGQPYYVMEYIKGPDLKEELQVNGPFQRDRALSFMEQMASALDHYHGLSMVHRDLKPSNIMVDGERFVISDFGLARDLERTKMTKTGTVLGSPLYMSPELASGRASDHRSDIFQLGVICYEVLTSKSPFQGNTLAEILYKVESHHPPLVHELKPSLDEAWSRVISCCIEKEPKDRYQSAGELLEDIQRIKLGYSIVDRALPPAAKKPGKWRFSALALTMVGLLFASTMLHWLYEDSPSESREAFTPKKLELEVGLSTAMVSWESKRPYASTVKIVAKDGSEQIKSTDEQTCKHRILLSDLEENREYKMSIVYPSGESSLARKFTTHSLDLELLSASREGNELSLTWSCDLGGSWQLYSRSPNSKQGKFTAARQIGKRWEASLKVPKGEEEKLCLRRFAPDGSSYELELKNLLSQFSRDCIAKLKSFDPEEMIRPLAIEVAPEANSLLDSLKEGKEDIQEQKRIARLKGAKALPYLQKRLRETGALEVDKRARDLAPLLFTGKLLDLELLSQVCWQLQKIHRFFFSALFNDCPIDYDFESLPGDFALSCVPLKGKILEMSIFKAPEGEYEVLGMYNSVIVDMNKNKERLELSFFLDEIKGLDGAEFRIKVKGSYNRIAMELKLNSLKKLLIPDLRHWFPRTELYPKKGLLCQRIPPRALKRGENSLLITTNALYRAFTRNIIKLEEIRLALQRK